MDESRTNAGGSSDGPPVPPQPQPPPAAAAAAPAHAPTMAPGVARPPTSSLSRATSDGQFTGSASEINTGSNTSSNSSSTAAERKFPWTLHRILDEAEKEGNQHIVAWMTSGKSFVVHKRDVFTTQILPRYFRQTKYKSFVRQLNLWGFSFIDQGPDRGSYYCEHFVNGKPWLCHEMKRIKVKTRSNSSPSITSSSSGVAMMVGSPTQSPLAQGHPSTGMQMSSSTSLPLFPSGSGVGTADGAASAATAAAVQRSFQDAAAMGTTMSSGSTMHSTRQEQLLHGEWAGYHQGETSNPHAPSSFQYQQQQQQLYHLQAHLQRQQFSSSLYNRNALSNQVSVFGGMPTSALPPASTQMGLIGFPGSHQQHQFEPRPIQQSPQQRSSRSRSRTNHPDFIPLEQQTIGSTQGLGGGGRGVGGGGPSLSPLAMPPFMGGNTTAAIADADETASNTSPSEGGSGGLLGRLDPIAPHAAASSGTAGVVIFGRALPAELEPRPFRPDPFGPILPSLALPSSSSSAAMPQISPPPPPPARAATTKGRGQGGRPDHPPPHGSGEDYR